MFRRIIKILFFILVIPGAIITLFFAEGAKINKFWWSQQEAMKENEFHLVQTYHLLGLHDEKNSYISIESTIDKSFKTDDELNSVTIKSYPFTLFDKKQQYDAFTFFISDLKIYDDEAYTDDGLYYLTLEYHFNKKVHNGDQSYSYIEDRPMMISEDKETYFFFSYLPDFVDADGKNVEIETIKLFYGKKDETTTQFLVLSNTLISDYKDMFSNDDNRHINDFTVENNSLSKRINVNDAVDNDSVYFDQDLESQKKKYRHYPYTYMGIYVLVSASIAYFLFFHDEFVKTMRYRRSQRLAKKHSLKEEFKEEYINKGDNY